MSAQLRPRRRRSPNRRRNPRIASTLVPTFAYVSPVLTVTVDEPCIVNAVPQYALNTAELPASYEQTSPTEFELTYAVGGAATDVTVPDMDRAVRSTTRGFVAPGTFPLA